MSIFTKLLWASLGAFGTLTASAQLTITEQFPHASLRGLCAVNENVIWVSGSNGTIGRSIDGGVTWTQVPVPGFAGRDFRDIHAFDDHTAVIMGIDTPAVILHTADAGAHWMVALRDATPGMFLDAMDFTEDMGIVVGDPVKTTTGNRFYLAITTNGGRNWHPTRNGPVADSGEACFASSGSNIHEVMDADFGYPVFVSGGTKSRLLQTGSSSGDSLPLLQGATSTGANSIDAYRRRWIVVGGDFQRDTLTAGNCTYSTDLGQHWLIPHTPPHGYRSCVIHITGDTWLCCGTSGIDISKDGGDHWALISKESFHVAAYSGSGKYVILAGAKGRIARLDWTKF